MTYGGNLFVSGSEIAWDLGAKGSTTDKNFLHDYLKVDYENDDSNSYTVKGETGSLFQGLTLSYGVSTSPYPEDYPDTFLLSSEGKAVLRYGTNKIAGASYEGLFGDGTIPGKVLVLAFPFETITTSSNQNLLMGRILNNFFGEATAVAAKNNDVPQRFTLSQNYPNPFNLQKSNFHAGQTRIDYSLPENSIVNFRIYDVLGRTIKEWKGMSKSPGTYNLDWDGKNNLGQHVAAGVYFWEMTSHSIKNVNDILQRNSIKILVR